MNSKPNLKPNRQNDSNTRSEEETAMAKANEQDLRTSTRPMTSRPSKVSSKHNTMAVYVAVTKQVEKVPPDSRGPAIEEQNPFEYKSETEDVPGKEKNFNGKILKNKTPKQQQMNVRAVIIQPDDTEPTRGPNFDAAKQKISYPTEEDRRRTPPTKKSVIQKQPQVYAVEIASNSSRSSDQAQRPEVLVAKESYVNVAEQTRRKMEELASEAKPLLFRNLLDSPMLQPIQRTGLRLPERNETVVTPPACVLAQELMKSLSREVFDPGKMLEIHVAVRLPFSQSPQPSTSEESQNYYVEIATTIRRNQLCTSDSCIEKRAHKNESYKIAKTVFPTVIGGRQVMIDENFVDIIYRHMQMEGSWSTQTGDRTPSAAPNQSIESFPPTPMYPGTEDRTTPILRTPTKSSSRTSSMLATRTPTVDRSSSAASSGTRPSSKSTPVQPTVAKPEFDLVKNLRSNGIDSHHVDVEKCTPISGTRSERSPISSMSFETRDQPRSDACIAVPFESKNIYREKSKEQSPTGVSTPKKEDSDAMYYYNLIAKMNRSPYSTSRDGWICAVCGFRQGGGCCGHELTRDKEKNKRRR